LFLVAELSTAQEFSRQEANFNIVGSYGLGATIGGGGISFADFNDDGLDDLTFGTFSGYPLKFYKNLGDSFEEITFPTIVNTYDQKQIIWVDYDNDEDIDLFVTAMDGPNLLYENDGTFDSDGNMMFSEVSVARGLSSQVVLSVGANFADIDKDGYLDLYICNYDDDGITINGNTNEFYRWDHQNNVYQDISLSSGAGNGVRASFCTAFFDFDMDNDLDLYVINDYPAFENSLYMNIGGGQFIDVSVPSQSNISIYSMNSAISDFDRDGDFDIFITDIYQAALLQNNGNNSFTDVAVSANVAVDEWSWTANFLDYDNDKDDDLYVSSQVDVEPNYFFVNNNDGTFSEPLASSGGITGDDALKAISNAIGDVNNDGLLDIAVSPRDDGNFRIYVNNEESGNNFIKLDLKGISSNIDGYGAYIETWIDDEKTIYHKHCTVALQCQNSDYLHIGIGQSTAVDSILIRWPFSNNEDLILTGDILVNGMNVIEEGQGLVDSYSLEICKELHNIVIDPVSSQTYGAELNLECASQLNFGSTVLFQSESIISLESGFEVGAGVSFEAEIEVCGN